MPLFTLAMSKAESEMQRERSGVWLSVRLSVGPVFFLTLMRLWLPNSVLTQSAYISDLLSRRPIWWDRGNHFLERGNEIVNVLIGTSPTQGCDVFWSACQCLHVCLSLRPLAYLKNSSPSFKKILHSSQTCLSGQQPLGHDYEYPLMQSFHLSMSYILHCVENGTTQMISI